MRPPPPSHQEALQAARDESGLPDPSRNKKQAAWEEEFTRRKFEEAYDTHLESNPNDHRGAFKSAKRHLSGSEDMRVLQDEQQKRVFKKTYREKMAKQKRIEDAFKKFDGSNRDDLIGSLEGDPQAQKELRHKIFEETYKQKIRENPLDFKGAFKQAVAAADLHSEDLNDDEIGRMNDFQEREKSRPFEDAYDEYLRNNPEKSPEDAFSHIQEEVYKGMEIDTNWKRKFLERKKKERSSEDASHHGLEENLRSIDEAARENRLDIDGKDEHKAYVEDYKAQVIEHYIESLPPDQRQAVLDQYKDQLGDRYNRILEDSVGQRMGERVSTSSGVVKGSKKTYKVEGGVRSSREELRGGSLGRGRIGNEDVNMESTTGIATRETASFAGGKLKFAPGSGTLRLEGENRMIITNHNEKPLTYKIKVGKSHRTVPLEAGESIIGERDVRGKMVYRVRRKDGSEVALPVTKEDKQRELRRIRIKREQMEEHGLHNTDGYRALEAEEASIKNYTPNEVSTEEDSNAYEGKLNKMGVANKVFNYGGILANAVLSFLQASQVKDPGKRTGAYINAAAMTLLTLLLPLLGEGLASTKRGKEFLEKFRKSRWSSGLRLLLVGATVVVNTALLIILSINKSTIKNRIKKLQNISKKDLKYTHTQTKTKKPFNLLSFIFSFFNINKALSGNFTKNMKFCITRNMKIDSSCNCRSNNSCLRLDHNRLHKVLRNSKRPSEYFKIFNGISHGKLSPFDPRIDADKILKNSFKFHDEVKNYIKKRGRNLPAHQYKQFLIDKMEGKITHFFNNFANNKDMQSFIHAFNLVTSPQAVTKYMSIPKGQLAKKKILNIAFKSGNDYASSPFLPRLMHHKMGKKAPAKKETMSRIPEKTSENYHRYKYRSNINKDSDDSIWKIISLEYSLYFVPANF